MEKKLFPVATRLTEREYAKINDLLLRAAPLCTKIGPLVRVLLLIAMSVIDSGIVRLELDVLQELQSQIRLRPLHPLRIGPKKESAT